MPLPGPLILGSTSPSVDTIRGLYLEGDREFVDSPVEEDGFELVWGFSCQVVVFGLMPVLCSERERPFFVPSPAIRFAERAEGVKGPKR